MSALSTTAAANINASHRLAMMCAGEAILHARSAGEVHR